MTTVRAASNATLSGALVPRRAVAVPQRAAHQEVAAQEAVRREAAIPRRVRLRETQVVAAVAQAVMKMTITHRAVEVVGEGDEIVLIPPAPLKRGTRKATQSLRPIGVPLLRGAGGDSKKPPRWLN